MQFICTVCGTSVPPEEIVKEAFFKNLPSPCCEICYAVRDDTDTTIATVAAKSVAKRAELRAKLNPPAGQ